MFHHFRNILDCFFGQQHVLVFEEIVGVQISRRHDHAAGDIANGLDQRFNGLLVGNKAGTHQPKRLHRVRECARLRSRVVKLVNDFQLLIFNLGQKRGFERFAAHAHRHIFMVVARTRSECVTTAAPQRRTLHTGASTTCVLLLERLDAGTGTLRLGLDLMGTDALVRFRANDSLVQKFRANLLAEDLLVEGDRPDHRARRVKNLNVHRIRFLTKTKMATSKGFLVKILNFGHWPGSFRNTLRHRPLGLFRPGF